jgi:hypothetical protein
MRGTPTLIAGIVLTMLSGTQVFSQPITASPDMPADVEQCIKTNAPSVEQTISSLSDGVEFLVGDLCAVAIAREQQRNQEVAMAAFKAAMKKQCDSRAESSSSSSTKQTDDEESALCTPAAYDATALSGFTLYAPGYNKPAVVTAFAAKLLLDLRLERTSNNHN